MLGTHAQMSGNSGAITPSPSFPFPVSVGCTSTRVGLMFLTEVALGKQYCITCDEPTLQQPPDGYDSVLACGRTEPGERWDWRPWDGPQGWH